MPYRTFSPCADRATLKKEAGTRHLFSKTKPLRAAVITNHDCRLARSVTSAFSSLDHCEHVQFLSSYYVAWVVKNRYRSVSTQPPIFHLFQLVFIWAWTCGCVRHLPLFMTCYFACLECRSATRERFDLGLGNHIGPAMPFIDGIVQTCVDFASPSPLSSMTIVLL